MPEIDASHDALIELAHSNSGGMTLTDAAHAGLPVVATDVGDVANVVSYRFTGILVADDPL